MSLKVLSLIPTKNLMGGGEKSFFELLQFMQNQGYKNYALIPKDSSKELIESLNRCGVVSIVGTFDALNLHRDRSLSELDEVFAIAKVIRDIRPDVFMTNLYVEPSQWAAALCNVPHVYFDRGQLGLLFNRGILPINPPAFTRYANEIVCNSKNGQDILKKNYGINSSLVYSYVPEVKAKLSKHPQPRIVIPANFFPEKNHLDILAAIVKVKKRQAKFNTEVILMGSKVSANNSEYFTRILKYINLHHLEDMVKIMDYQKNPWNLFTKDDIYINSGEGEAVGRATIEAEMLGITSLIADIPGHWEHRELLGNSHTFRLHDIDDLADKIEYLLNPLNQEIIKKHNRAVQSKTLQWMTRENAMGDILNVMERVKGEDNPARTLVYDDIFRIAKSLHRIDDLDSLHEPGIRDAAKELKGAVRRKIRKITQ